MRIYYSFFIALLLLVFLSCKDESATKQNLLNRSKEENNQKYSEDFSIIIRTRVDKRDSFQIFYKQEPSEFYNEIGSVTTTVLPLSDFQNVEIKLPSDVYPNNIRLDLGTNKNQGSIQIEYLTLNYEKKSYKIKGEDIPKYFILNEGVEIGTDAITYLLKTHERESTIVYDPFLIGKPELNDVIYKEL